MSEELPTNSSLDTVETPSSPFTRQNPFDRPDEQNEIPPLTLELEADVAIPETKSSDDVEGLRTTAKLLSDGLLAHLLPPLETTNKYVGELSEKQAQCMNVIQEENQRLRLFLSHVLRRARARWQEIVIMRIEL